MRHAKQLTVEDAFQQSIGHRMTEPLERVEVNHVLFIGESEGKKSVLKTATVLDDRHSAREFEVFSLYSETYCWQERAVLGWLAGV